MSENATAELLGRMVPLLHVRPVIEDFCRFGGTWETRHTPNGARWAQFHMVTRGSCTIVRPGLDDIVLSAGDILLMPHGESHVVRARISGAAGRVNSELRNGVRVRGTDGPADTELLCGRLHFEGDHPLVAALPDEMVVRTAGDPGLLRYQQLLAAIRDELDGGAAGGDMIAADFARALFVMVLRDYLGGAPAGASTLALLRDRTTARAVLAVLDDLARDWTLDDLAAVAVASRATLVRAFHKHAGMAPMAFLADLRLATARQRIAGTADPIARIAAEVGYGSEGALSKAILRKWGVRPGALRSAGA